MKRSPFTLICLCFLLQNCAPDSFWSYKVVGERPYIATVLINADSIATGIVRKPRLLNGFIPDTAHIENLKDAIINLYHNNTHIDQLVYRRDKENPFFRNVLSFHEGTFVGYLANQQYTMRLLIDDQELKASTSIPEVVVPLNVNFYFKEFLVDTLRSHPEEQGVPIFRYRLSLDLPKGEATRYYFITFTQTQNFGTIQTRASRLRFRTNLPFDDHFLYYDEENPIQGPASQYEYFAFSDEAFLSENIHFELMIDAEDWSIFANTLVYTVHIHTTNQDYFNYYRTAHKAYNIKDMPFAEPVTVYSNINGGLGVFGAYRTILSLDMLESQATKAATALPR